MAACSLYVEYNVSHISACSSPPAVPASDFHLFLLFNRCVFNVVMNVLILRVLFGRLRCVLRLLVFHIS